MHSWRKTTATALAAAIVVGSAACGSKHPERGTSATRTSAPVSTTTKPSPPIGPVKCQATRSVSKPEVLDFVDRSTPQDKARIIAYETLVNALMQDPDCPFGGAVQQRNDGKFIPRNIYMVGDPRENTELLASIVAGNPLYQPLKVGKDIFIKETGSTFGQYLAGMQLLWKLRNHELKNDAQLGNMQRDFNSKIVSLTGQPCGLLFSEDSSGLAVVLLYEKLQLSAELLHGVSDFLQIWQSKLGFNALAVDTARRAIDGAWFAASFPSVKIVNACYDKADPNYLPTTNTTAQTALSRVLAPASL